MSQRADTGTSRTARVSNPPDSGLPDAEDSDFFRGNDISSPTAGSDTTQFFPATSMPVGPETELIPNTYAAPPVAPRVSAADDTMLIAAVPDLSSRALPGNSSQALPGNLESGPVGATAISPPESPSSAQHRSSTLGMWAGVVVFWLLAMPIGVMSAIIVAGRRATLCSKSSTGFGCTSTGSSVGVVLLVILVALVGTVSVYAYDVRHSARRWLAGLGIGVVLLAVLGLTAWLLVRTIQ